MPEKHFQMPDENHGTRRLTPERMAFDAFGRCVKTKPNQVVSSLLVERSRIFDLGHMLSNRGDVLKDHSLLSRAAFDPHVKEVGKK